MNQLLNIFKRLTSKDPGGNSEQKGFSYKVSELTPKKPIGFGRVISFCIEPDAIQMAAVSHIGNKKTVLEVSKEYFLKSDIEDDQKEPVITDILSRFIEKHYRPLSRIVLSVPGEHIIFRTMILPFLPKKELASAVAFEAKKLLPFAVEDSYYDFRTTSLIESSKEKKYRLSLHASHRQQVDKELAYFQKITQLPERVYHSQDCIGQLLRSLDDFYPDKNYTLINIGHHNTSISFYRGANLEFSHSSQVSSSMMGAKKDHATYEYFAETLASEIQNSLDYYSGQISGDYNPNIFVYGDFAYSEELLKLMNDMGAVHLEVFPIDSLHLKDISGDVDSINFAVCLTALAAAMNMSELANLLPHDKQTILKEKKQLRYAQAAAAVVVLSAGISWGVINDDVNRQQESVKDLQKQVDEFTHSESYHLYNAIKREILFNQAFMEKIKSEPSHFGYNLKELTRVTPSAIKLFNLELNQDDTTFNFHLQGVVLARQVPPEVILAEFIENLNASPFYANVEIVRHVKKQKDLGFEVEFLLKMKGVV